MSLFQTSYHVNTWISISLLHIISSTSVISKKRRRMQTQKTLHYILDSPPGPVCQSAHLGHLPLPCSMKNPTLSTTLNWDDPQPPDPTSIHIKLGWSSPCLFIAPTIGSPTNRFANHRIHGAELRFCSSPSKLQSLMVPSLEAFFWVMSVFSVTVKSRCQKRWGEPLQQLQV